MGVNTFEPAVPQSAKDIMLGEGVLYVDYGEIGEAVIGATRGGSKVEIERTIKTVDYDGAMGATKGMRRTERFVVTLVVNFLKLTYTNFVYGLNATTADGTDGDGTYKKITFDTTFASTDMLTNITFKGYKANGKYCIITITNALDIGNVGIEFKEKDEVVTERTYTGFYTYAAPTTPPLTIQEEV